jgi:hypothetical protein
MRPSRVILIVVGSLLALMGLGVLAGGTVLGWALGTQRDDDGFFTTSEYRLATDSYALTSDEIHLGSPGPDDWWADRELATGRVVADGAESGELFVGIGPERDVEAYLAGVPHDVVTDLDDAPFDVDLRRENAAGSATPTPPGDETFWVASASGAGTQTVTWDLEPGRWLIVVMNADASADVVADVELGGKLDGLVLIAIGLGVAGGLLAAGGAAMIVGGAVGARRDQAAAAPATAPGVPAFTQSGATSASTSTSTSSPVRLEGYLDPDVSRWQWLVKWFLAIPHFVVLAFLWIAFVVTTFVAFFAILFTGKYPRSIFDFNVGVLRWTWRVSFYATSAIGTDRYPPFTLAPADYPATLDIAHPERLSRGLVLVKSWLLAIPHLLILGVIMATWTLGDRDGAWFVFGGGLIGILVVVAAVMLLFTGRYPRGLFDFIVGLDRWIYRVIAYVALMTDQYPPFQLDQGPTEPRPRDDGGPTRWNPPVREFERV